MRQFSHGLLRYGGISDPDRSAPLGGGTTREGVGKMGGVVDLGARVP
jgi:hypothetical protein